MGICASIESTAVAAATAKLILPDGRLQEYACPVRASQVSLPKDQGCLFVCNADDMEFDGYIAAVGADEALQPGQIYFALPRSMLRRRLLPEDMAALAVRASAALVKSGCAAVVSGGGDEEKAYRRVVPVAPPSAAAAAEGGRRSRKVSRGRSFSSDLIAIPELETEM